jgi:hypothetical protein
MQAACRRLWQDKVFTDSETALLVTCLNRPRYSCELESTLGAFVEREAIAQHLETHYGPRDAAGQPDSGGWTEDRSPWT